MTLFTEDDARRISKSITAAEHGTSGEIVAVVAEKSSSYRHVPFMWAALIALLVPWPFIHFTWMKVQWIYLLQLLVFAAVVFTLWPVAVRIRLVPKSARNNYVRRRATEQFLAQSLHTTTGRTGVLLFVSVAERRVEIIPDSAIDAKVPNGTWQSIVDDFTNDLSAGRGTDGFIKAIERIGKLLGEHFPPSAIDPNELPDHLIVLRS